MRRYSDNNKKLFMYVFMFFIVWTVYELTIKLWIQENCGLLLSEIIQSVIKMGIWFVPCILLLRNNDEVFVPLNQIFTNKIKWRIWLPILPAVALGLMAASWLEFGNLILRDSFNTEKLISTVLFVGITEEIVFRGYILNSLLVRMNQYFAIAISSFLFLFIHFPVWFHSGVLVSNIISGAFIQILVLSIVFSYSFIKSKNIIVPILIHMVWNLFSVLFFN